MLNSNHFSLLLLLAIFCLPLALAFVKGDKYGEYNSEGSFDRINGRGKHNMTVKEVLKKSSLRLSAVGVIMLILTVILSGVFIYYFFLFYPILCRKERNYDVVEHSRDTTPTPNTENNL